MRILFVCSMAALRSPTFAKVMQDQGYNAKYAGVSDDALEPITKDLVDWSDVVFCMSQHYKRIVRRRFSEQLSSKDIVNLNIEDEYYYMEPRLVELAKLKMSEFDLLITGVTTKWLPFHK